MNRYFESEEIPLELVHFGSLFRFASNANIDLLYYHLLEKGVYIWEGRNCFLSTAHSDEDIEFLIRAIQESVTELRQGGFLTRKTLKIKEPEQRKNEVNPGKIALPSSFNGSKLNQSDSYRNFCKLLTPRAIYQRLAPQIAEITQEQELGKLSPGFFRARKVKFGLYYSSF